MSRLRPQLVTSLALALLLTLLTGCSRQRIVDFAMSSAPVPLRHRGLHVAEYEILAGDLHCHVLPPDVPWHVSRALDETLELAAREGLDFVVLTPHVPGRFFVDPELRAWVQGSQQRLRARLASRRTSVLVVPGFEYTDRRYGHVGAAFADVDAVLADVPIAVARRHPERFFERWVARGGVLTINHPLLRPLPNAPLAPLRYDLSWRGFEQRVPVEIAWLTQHAQTIETYNLSLSFLRDGLLFADADRSLRESAHLVDRQVRGQHRRLTPVGGSDSHGAYLRPTTYVLATARTKDAVRDAIVEGRTCVRGPEACSFQLRVRGGEWASVGSPVRSPDGVLEARAALGDAVIDVNGVRAIEVAQGRVGSLTVPPDRCTLVRAIAGSSWSAPIYVNCDFADRLPAAESVDAAGAGPPAD